MADVDMTNKMHAIVESTNGADRTVLLETQYAYRLIHTGKDVSNVDATATIILTTSETTTAATVTATMAASTNKYPLQSGAFVYVGPGVKTLAHKSMSGSPAFAIERNVHMLGKF